MGNYVNAHLLLYCVHKLQSAVVRSRRNMDVVVDVFRFMMEGTCQSGEQVTSKWLKNCLQYHCVHKQKSTVVVREQQKVPLYCILNNKNHQSSRTAIDILLLLL